MKITICSSAGFAAESFDIQEKLERFGHTVYMYPSELEINGKKIPVSEYYKMRKENIFGKGVLELKSKLMKLHTEKIEKSDAILVLNFDKNGISGYVGGNTLMEMAVAHFLEKKIFLWQAPSEELSYFEEIAGMEGTVINRDLERIVS